MLTSYHVRDDRIVKLAVLISPASAWAHVLVGDAQPKAQRSVRSNATQIVDIGSCRGGLVGASGGLVSGRPLFVIADSAVIIDLASGRGNVILGLVSDRRTRRVL